MTWAMFEEEFLGSFFPRELREAMIGEFLNLKQDSTTNQEYNFKFTQLSHYAPEMVANIRNKINLYVSGLGRSTKKEGRRVMLIKDMVIARLISYMQQTKEEKLRDREEKTNKSAKTISYKGSKK